MHRDDERERECVGDLHDPFFGSCGSPARSEPAARGDIAASRGTLGVLTAARTAGACRGPGSKDEADRAMSAHLDDTDKAALAELLHQVIVADHYTLSPTVMAGRVALVV